jgi:hypothetical protein
MRAIKRADRPRRHHEPGKDPPGLAIPAGLTLASDLPEKRQENGPDDASDMKSSRADITDKSSDQPDGQN